MEMQREVVYFFLMQTGEKIKVSRERRGLTQERLGELLGVSYQAVGKWEKGISLPSSDKIAGLCSILGRDANYLFLDDNFALSDEERKLNDEIITLLRCARVVMESNSIFGEALKKNIEAFYAAVGCPKYSPPITRMRKIRSLHTK